MSQNDPVIKALSLIKAGDKAFDVGDHRQALSCFQEAMSLAQQVPADEWDQKGFFAICSACLSGPLGALNRPKQAVEQANRALAFFDFHGEMYPAEFGRWVMATFNKGAALLQLGHPEQALSFIRKAKSMLSAGEEYQNLRSMCDHNIKIIESVLGKTRGENKPWWKFW